jgi:hypothetical protein
LPFNACKVVSKYNSSGKKQPWALTVSLSLWHIATVGHATKPLAC